MAAAFLLAALCGSLVVAQDKHSDSVFAYMGCSSVDLSRFEKPIVFAGGHLLPEACQDACHGHQFAAVLPDACHCGDDAGGVVPVDESLCSSACMGDAALGTCGGFDKDQGRHIADVYNWLGSDGVEPAVSLFTMHTFSLRAAATESPCSTSEYLPSAPAPPASFLTPDGPVSEAPVFSSTCLSEEVPPPAPTFPHTPQAGEAWTTSCSQHDHPATEVPAPREPSHVLTSQSPERLTWDTAETAAPRTTQGPSPPEYYSQGEASPTPGCGETDGVDCTPTRPVEASAVPSERTLWPAAPYASDTTFETRVPSVVPVSGATDGLAPNLSAFGGLALIVAMIM